MYRGRGGRGRGGQHGEVREVRPYKRKGATPTPSVSHTTRGKESFTLVDDLQPNVQLLSSESVHFPTKKTKLDHKDTEPAHSPVQPHSRSLTTTYETSQESLQSDQNQEEEDYYSTAQYQESENQHYYANQPHSYYTHDQYTAYDNTGQGYQQQPPVINPQQQQHSWNSSTKEGVKPAKEERAPSQDTKGPTDAFGRRRFVPKSQMDPELNAIKQKLSKDSRLSKYDSKKGNSTSEALFLDSRAGRGVTAEQMKRSQQEHARKLNKWDNVERMKASAASLSGL